MKLPDASITEPPSVSRHCPIASKFSNAKPIGSKLAWQLTQAGLVLCAVTRSRIERAWSAGVFPSGGTLGAGGGVGVPKTFSKIDLPRMMGDVRLETDVTVSQLP